VVATNKLSTHAPPNQKGWYIVSYVFFILSEIISYIAGSLLFYFNDLFPSQVDFSGILINLFYVLGIFASILSPISLFILSFKMNQHKDYFGWNFKPVYTSYLYLVFSIINGIFGGLNSYLWQNYLLGFILNFSYIALILAFYFEFYIRCKNIYKDEDDLLVELET
ncbi:MAG: hypothetical protein U9O98_03645, partial [Asgard group archaeon]|nr:hypothetical protein [Asgard group archaeon]